jgi:hypothetical protein
MPAEWASSGAKLGFSLQLEFTDELCWDEMTEDKLLRSDAMMGSQLLVVNPLNEPVFVSNKGSETINVLSGAYGGQMIAAKSQKCALRFFLEFPDGAQRNDVTLPEGRIYFLASCWIENKAALEKARKKTAAIKETIQQINDKLEELDQSSGFIQKAIAFQQALSLVEKRGNLKSQLNKIEKQYPIESGQVFRAPNDVLFAKDGVIAIRRPRDGTSGASEQYQWVGTFAFNKFSGDEGE